MTEVFWRRAASIPSINWSHMCWRANLDLLVLPLYHWAAPLQSMIYRRWFHDLHWIETTIHLSYRRNCNVENYDLNAMRLRRPQYVGWWRYWSTNDFHYFAMLALNGTTNAQNYNNISTKLSLGVIIHNCAIDIPHGWSNASILTQSERKQGANRVERHSFATAKNRLVLTQFNRLTFAKWTYDIRVWQEPARPLVVSACGIACI